LVTARLIRQRDERADPHRRSRVSKALLQYVAKNGADPKINLSCGVDIMANQIRKRGSITLPPGKGAYWAVLISGGKYQKIDEIKKRVQDASRNCRK